MQVPTIDNRYAGRFWNFEWMIASCSSSFLTNTLCNQGDRAGDDRWTNVALSLFLLERNTQHRQPFRSCMVMVLWKCWSRLMQQHVASDEDIAMLDMHEPASSSSYKSILTQFSRSSRIQPTPLHGFGDISLIQSRNEVIIIVVTMILLLRLNLPWFLLLVLLILRLI